MRGRRELTDRGVGVFAGLLLLLAGAVASSASTATPTAYCQGWDPSDASMIRTHHSAISRADVDRAIFELTTAVELVQLELGKEPAHARYLDFVERAADSYEASHGGIEAALALASTLAVARSVLLESVSGLPAWLSVVDIVAPETERFPRVPDRFRVATEPSTVREARAFEPDVCAWMDLAPFTVA